MGAVVVTHVGRSFAENSAIVAPCCVYTRTKGSGLRTRTSALAVLGSARSGAAAPAADTPGTDPGGAIAYSSRLL